MLWLEATYQPTTLFSLRPSWATSTGGKSLLLPSPYAIKMALLDVALITSGQDAGKKAWPWLSTLSIAIDLPSQIVVTNLFSRILRQKEIKSKASEKDAAISKAQEQMQWPYQNTIAFREYVYYAEPLRLAFGLEQTEQADQLRNWLCQINYLGKRGGFVQLLTPPTILPDCEVFLSLTEEQTTFAPGGVIQQLDDCGPKMTFAQADIYDSKSANRQVRHIVIPYRLTKSSKSYSLYDRI